MVKFYFINTHLINKYLTNLPYVQIFVQMSEVRNCNPV